MRYFLLDPLRGIAAIWVLMLHYSFSTDFQETLPFLYALVRNGEMGVAMFFVISGYCLTASARSAMRRSESVWQFLYRRARRIYPPFWCSVLLVAAIPFVIEFVSSVKTGEYVAPSPQNSNYGYLEYGSLDWLRVVTLTQAFYPSGQTIGEKFTSINSVYWSLAIEEQFYLVMALGLFFLGGFYWILAIILGISIPFALVESFYRSGIFLPWWPMFAWGVGLYYVTERGFTAEHCFGNWAVWVSVVVMSAAVGVFFFYIYRGGMATHQAFAPCFAVVLWFATVFDGAYKRLTLRTDALSRIAIGGLMTVGLMSYSIYLIHGRLQFLVIQLVRQFTGQSIVQDMLVIIVTVAMCYPFYRLCEAPFYTPRVAEPDFKATTEICVRSGSIIQPQIEG